MDRPTCKTCPYWNAPKHHEYLDEDEPERGDCRKYNPVFRPDMSAEMGACQPWDGWWPTTSETQFCGEHPNFPAWIASRRQEQE